MKKVFAVLIAVLLIAFSTLSAFAVISPTAVPPTTSTSETQPTPTQGSGDKTIDKGGKSPQTGSSDSVVFIILGLSAAAAVAGVITAKHRFSEK